jgi:CO/xanthine dehydrogenase Mo-binding subunit
MPLNKIRIHHVHIGGAFGGLSDTFPVEFTAALLSIKTGRPVRIACSREETMNATRHKHATIVELKMGVKRDGTLLGTDCRVILDGGAYMSSGPMATSSLLGVGQARYRIPNGRSEAFRVYTNKTPCSEQRTHGCQVTLAVEMTLDRIAEDLGLDPIELRLRHARQAGDVLPGGSKITSYALSETIDKAVSASDWRQKKGKLPPGRGIGLACAGAVAGINLGFRMNSAALVKFNEDGSCSLFTGLVDNGQGNESMMVQIASEAMGIPVKDIALVCADSELTPPRPG